MLIEHVVAHLAAHYAARQVQAAVEPADPLWHADPATLPCGVCWHVLPGHEPGGGECMECCDRSCMDIDPDTGKPQGCRRYCCRAFASPRAPAGHPARDVRPAVAMLGGVRDLLGALRG